jgi:hypothetical protein
MNILACVLFVLGLATLVAALLLKTIGYGENPADEWDGTYW